MQTQDTTNTADALKDRVGEIKDRVEELKSRGDEMLGNVTRLIKANPLRAVAIAFGAGYLGTRLFR